MNESPNTLNSADLDKELSFVVERSFTLGSEAMDAGNHAEAVRVFAALVEIVPDNAEAHNMLEHRAFNLQRILHL